MQREPRAYLADILESCEAISTALSGMQIDDYLSNRLVRSSVEREFNIIGEAVLALRFGGLTSRSSGRGHGCLLNAHRNLPAADLERQVQPKPVVRGRPVKPLGYLLDSTINAL